jgi:hypothetical protein
MMGDRGSGAGLSEPADWREPELLRCVGKGEERLEWLEGKYRVSVSDSLSTSNLRKDGDGTSGGGC